MWMDQSTHTFTAEKQPCHAGLEHLKVAQQGMSKSCDICVIPSTGSLNKTLKMLHQKALLLNTTDSEAINVK